MPWTPEDWEGLLESNTQASQPDAPDRALIEILQRIPDRSRMKVAELGCVHAEHLSLLASHFGEVLAVASSERRLAAARSNGPDDNVRYSVADMEDLSDLAGSVDVALAMDVHRTLKNGSLDQFIEQAHGTLVEGGIMLLSVPAAKRIGGPVRLDLGKAARKPRRCFHEVELQYRMRRAGFQGLRIQRFDATDDGPGTLLCMAVRRAFN